MSAVATTPASGVLEELARISGTDNQTDLRIAKAIAEIERRLDQPITLEQIAAHVCLSPSRFRHLFAEEVGVPFVPFLSFGPLRLRSAVSRPIFPPPATIGDHLRRARAERALTQEEAASEIGVVRDALARWEVGSANPDVRTMPAVIRFLGYDPQPEPNSFPEILVHARRALGLSQPELAQALDVLPGTLRSWERKKSLPSADHMAATCERVRGLMSGTDRTSASTA